MENLEVVTVVQRIINAEPSQAKAILAAERPEIQAQVREQFRTNDNLRTLFPEFISAVTE